MTRLYKGLQPSTLAWHARFRERRSRRTWGSRPATRMSVLRASAPCSREPEAERIVPEATRWVASGRRALLREGASGVQADLACARAVGDDAFGFGRWGGVLRSTCGVLALRGAFGVGSIDR